MKKFYFFGIAAIIMLAALAGCTQSDPETVYVKVPVLADRTVQIGDKGNFEFDAFDAWTLTSSADWCELSAVSGDAGKQTVSYTVSDAGAEFNKTDVAELTLTVGSEVSTFKLTRAALVRELKIYDKDGNEVSAVVLDSNGAEAVHAEVTVKANFQWELEQATGWPEWLVKPGRLTPELDSETNLYTLTFTLEVALDQLNTRGTESEIVFSDLNSMESTVKVPVRYFGVEPSFFIAECEQGREITVTKEGFVCDKDGNATDKNYIELTVIGGEGLKFTPLNITYTSMEGEDVSFDSRAKWDITIEEITTRSAIDVKNYKVTFGAVPASFDYYGITTCYYLRANLMLVTPSISVGWPTNNDMIWGYQTKDTFLLSTYNNEGKYSYSIKEGFESYVFTFNVKDALQ